MPKGVKFWKKTLADCYDLQVIKEMDAMRNGHLMVAFYDRMMAYSIRHDGILQISEGKPHDLKSLSRLLRYENIAIIKKTLEVLEEYKLIKTQKDGSILMVAVPELCGYTTEEAERKAKQRAKKKEETL